MQEKTRNWRKIIGIVVGVLVLVLLVLQFVPLTMDNPAVVQEPAWDSPQTRDLAVVACYDCHSNETVWPWYSKIAPSRVLLWRDVAEGRDTMNFSDWGSGHPDADEIMEVIDSGEMPPIYYTWLHPDAKLSDAEKTQLMDGLQATIQGGITGGTISSGG